MRRLDSVVYSRATCDDCPHHGDFSYVAHWFQATVLGPPVVEKVGIAALLAILVDGYQSMGAVFWAAIVLWGCDMVTGTARAFVDEGVEFRWSKTIDGLLRLLIIVVVAITVAVAEGAVSQLAGVEVQGKILSFALGVIIVAELSSITGNVAFFYPGLREVKAKLIRLIPNQPPEVEDAAVVLSGRAPRQDAAVVVTRRTKRSDDDS